ncbi:MAG: hypothetical protein ACJAWS_001795 [Oleiphilaceae bacterium]|jgi:hypothetical protein
MKSLIQNLIIVIIFLHPIQVKADLDQEIEQEIRQYCLTLMQQENPKDDKFLRQCNEEQFQYLNHLEDPDEPKCSSDDNVCLSNLPS